jgi:hypothetical protein
MGSAGIGSIAHLTLLLFASLTHANIQHVPYRGLSQADNDHCKNVAASHLPSFILPCSYCGHRMAITAVAPAQLANEAPPQTDEVYQLARVV